MPQTDPLTEVIAYWNRRAPRFDGVASHVKHREAWWTVLAAAFGADGPRDVVDLGTGTGACALAAASLGHSVRAYDASAAMLAVAREAGNQQGLDVDWVERRLDSPDFEPGSADIVTLRNVLWTLTEPSAVLALAYRLLRPEGLIVVSDGMWSVSETNRSTYPSELAARLPLHRGVSEQEARALLADQGFETPESWQHLFDLSPYPGGTPFFVISAVRP